MFLFKLCILNRTAYYYAHALHINNKYATEMKRTPFLIFSSLKNGEKENTLVSREKKWEKKSFHKNNFDCTCLCIWKWIHVCFSLFKILQCSVKSCGIIKENWKQISVFSFYISTEATSCVMHCIGNLIRIFEFFQNLTLDCWMKMFFFGCIIIVIAKEEQNMFQNGIYVGFENVNIF